MQTALVQPGLVVLCYQVLTSKGIVILNGYSLQFDILLRCVSLLTVYHKYNINV